MGMFTSAIDKDGNEWQFKTGDDQCDEYPIGKPPKHGLTMGYKPIDDGVYPSVGPVDDNKCLRTAAVCVRNNIVIAIVEYSRTDDDMFEKMANALADKHKVPRPDDYCDL